MGQPASPSVQSTCASLRLSLVGLAGSPPKRDGMIRKVARMRGSF